MKWNKHCWIWHFSSLFRRICSLLPSSLCPSQFIRGIVLLSVEKKKKENMCGTIVRKWESDRDEDGEGRRQEVNKWIPRKIRNLETYFHPFLISFLYIYQRWQLSKHVKLLLLQLQLHQWHMCERRNLITNVRKLTFSNAECVVATGHEVIECDEQVGVILAGSSQQVLLGVPAGRFGQTRTLKVGSLESFWKITKKKKKSTVS